MKTHHLHLGPMTGRAMKTPVHHEGVEILKSHDPLHDAARYLLEHGIADPGDTLQTWRGLTPCMSGVASRLAEWIVVETDKDGLRMRKWSDVQADRARLTALPRRSRIEGGFRPMDFVVDDDFLSQRGDKFSEREAPSLAPSHDDLRADGHRAMKLKPARSRQG